MANAELIIEERLIEKIKTMPANRVAQILDFAEFIEQKEIEADNTKNADDSWWEKGEPCPICAKNRDPVTGEPRFNAETIAAFKEGDDMIEGRIPAKWYNSPDELWEALMKEDTDD